MICCTVTLNATQEHTRFRWMPYGDVNAVAADTYLRHRLVPMRVENLQHPAFKVTVAVFASGICVHYYPIPCVLQVSLEYAYAKVFTLVLMSSGDIDVKTVTFFFARVKRTFNRRCP